MLAIKAITVEVNNTLIAEIDKLKEMLRSVVSECWYVLSGGDDSSDKCGECGLAGYGELRNRLHEADKLLGNK